ncbi:MAG: hypothetical protein EA413_05290 [Cyanobium sp. PLM2.Bin73]|nr:MAG: hypothetical protein EA413_05290 [Cyanobium sp. PLM2.Bin73]
MPSPRRGLRSAQALGLSLLMATTSGVPALAAAPLAGRAQPPELRATHGLLIAEKDKDDKDEKNKKKKKQDQQNKHKQQQNQQHQKEIQKKAEPTKTKGSGGSTQGKALRKDEESCRPEVGQKESQ